MVLKSVHMRPGLLVGRQVQIVILQYEWAATAVWPLSKRLGAKELMDTAENTCMSRNSTFCSDFGFDATPISSGLGSVD